MSNCTPTQDTMMLLPVWTVARMLGALAHAEGYLEGLGKPNEYLSEERRILEEKVLDAFRVKE